ncbi:hypothetical protein ACQPYK_00920 [Streptosporangium sp. CA-135522]|uniref:hypothetical protein n=1 Tax=Streptosporangium sp. CA-135522 TaxID=3240072 RepID=UPI003D940566
MSVFAWIVLVVLIGAGAIWIRDIVKSKGRPRRTRISSRPSLWTGAHLDQANGSVEGVMLLDQEARQAHEREAEKLAD